MTTATTLEQVREAHPWMWPAPTSMRWQSHVPPGWLPILMALCDQVADLVQHDPQHHGFAIDRAREKWGFLGFEWRARGRGAPVERDADLKLLADIERLLSTAQERSKRTCAVCGRPGTLRRQTCILTLCDVHAVLHAEGRIPPAVLHGAQEPP